MNSATGPAPNLWKRLIRSPVMRAIAVMASATGVGQLIVFASLPILTRLYDPAAFGLYALITAYVGVASVGACLCLELAIVQCRDPAIADELCAAAVFTVPITTAISACVLALIVYTGVFGYGALPAGAVPVAALMAGLNGLYVASRYRHLREQHIRVLARATLLQSAGRALAPLAWFLVLPNWAGLSMGELTGRSLGVRGLLTPLLHQLKAQPVWGHARMWWTVVKRERRYTLVLLSTVLVDASASLLIMPLLAGAYGVGVTGEYFLVFTVLVAPAALVGTATADVLHTRSARLMHEAPQLLPAFVHRAGFLLFLAACAIYLPVYGLAPYVFPWIFGPKWTLIAPIAQAMTPFMIAAFVAGPCSRLLLVLDRTELKVGSDGVRLVGTPLVVGLASRWDVPFLPALWMMTSFLAAAYTLYFALTFLAVHQFNAGRRTGHRQPGR